MQVAQHWRVVQKFFSLSAMTFHGKAGRILGGGDWSAGAAALEGAHSFCTSAALARFCGGRTLLDKAWALLLPAAEPRLVLYGHSVRIKCCQFLLTTFSGHTVLYPGFTRASATRTTVTAWALHGLSRLDHSTASWCLETANKPRLRLGLRR